LHLTFIEREIVVLMGLQMMVLLLIVSPFGMNFHRSLRIVSMIIELVDLISDFVMVEEVLV
jgi:hypothetical protein